MSRLSLAFFAKSVKWFTRQLPRFSDLAKKYTDLAIFGKKVRRYTGIPFDSSSKNAFSERETVFESFRDAAVFPYG